jgi:catechol 2,3-dioxygenase-like lactoylglutathione lyase family enzyme
MVRPPTLVDNESTGRSSPMKPRIHIITLAVADLNQALAFYRDGLGFQTEGLIGTEFKGDETTPDGTTAVFDLDGGLMLSIYPRSELAKDASVPLAPANPGEFSIGHVVGSRGEVDEVISQAEAAGAAVTDRPHDRPWGVYSGYFEDPDGHLWEVLWNPALGPGTS